VIDIQINVNQQKNTYFMGYFWMTPKIHFFMFFQNKIKEMRL